MAENDAQVGMPAGAEVVAAAASARAALLARVNAVTFAEAPVVNSVPDPNPAEFLVPAPAGAGWAARRAAARLRRAAARLARRRKRYPEKFRVDFTEWVAVPWRDRPVEARLADYAHAIASSIERSPAWRGPDLDDLRVRLDPRLEAAEVAVAAYRLFEVRTQLGDRPTGTPNDALAHAQSLYDEHADGVRTAWSSLLDRVAAFAHYRDQLGDLASLTSAYAAIRHLSESGLATDVSALYADSARNEFASDDARDLADRVGGVEGSGGFAR